MASMAACSPMEVRTTTSVDESVRANVDSAVIDELTGVLLLLLKKLLDPVTNLSVGNLDVVLGLTVVGHQREETIVRNVKLAEY